ncbi:hypothetical protein K8R04_04525 [Candidatus Uhrbacteria bacterium]|jgi:hypothetical protein|nr:hypothetical protein [Candidatus Uhrbacteria bacterium]
MSTSTKTRTNVTTVTLALLGVAAVSAIAIFTLNPRARSYLTKPFRPYQILPGYVTPGYTPGYVAPAPGYIRIDPRRPR